MINDAVFYGFIAGTLGIILLIALLVIMLILNINRKNRFEAAEKEQKFLFQNELQNSRIELQEHILDEVSKEIHDNVGQVLSLVKLHLYKLRSQVADGAASQLIENSSGLLDKAIDDLRLISHSKNTGMAAQAVLEDSLRRELDYITHLRNMEGLLDSEGVQTDFSPDHTLLIYRIAQEALNNAVKHARCSRISIHLAYMQDSFTMTITDNGDGFDSNKISRKNGIGLSHMRHRAKLLSGSLNIKSAPGNGTVIVLNIPRYEKEK